MRKENVVKGAESVTIFEVSHHYLTDKQAELTVLLVVEKL